MIIAILRNRYDHVRNVHFVMCINRLCTNHRAQFVKELLVRNNEISLRDFTMSEISALIECVCVT